MMKGLTNPIQWLIRIPHIFCDLRLVVAVEESFEEILPIVELVP